MSKKSMYAQETFTAVTTNDGKPSSVSLMAEMITHILNAQLTGLGVKNPDVKADIQDTDPDLYCILLFDETIGDSGNLPRLLKDLLKTFYQGALENNVIIEVSGTTPRIQFDDKMALFKMLWNYVLDPANKMCAVDVMQTFYERKRYSFCDRKNCPSDWAISSTYRRAVEWFKPEGGITYLPYDLPDIFSKILDEDGPQSLSLRLHEGSLVWLH